MTNILKTSLQAVHIYTNQLVNTFIKHDMIMKDPSDPVLSKVEAPKTQHQQHLFMVFIGVCLQMSPKLKKC